MVSIVFDTNILIDHLRGIGPAGEELERYPNAGISISTWMEIMAGAADAREEAMLRRFLGAFAVFAIEDAIAETASRLKRRHRLKLPDAIIWATAISPDVPLVTRNTKDFRDDVSGILVPYRL